MKQVLEQKCPDCGAALRFDPEKGLLVCDHCQKEIYLSEEMIVETEEQAEETEITGFDFDSLTDQAVQINAEDLPVYHCDSCGAEVLAAPEQFSLTCPYCRNPIVLTEKVAGMLRPDGVLPFKIEAKDLPQAVNAFYSDKKLLPKSFFTQNSMRNITGVYVPFWVFNGKLQGRVRYSAENESSSRSGDYIIATKDFYDVERDVEMEFENVPVDASERIADDLMDSMEPFDFSEEKKYNNGYLAGFTADRFDVKKDEIAKRAERRMQNTANALVDAAVGAQYTSAERRSGSLAANIKARYLLLPVYLFNIRYHDQDYSFAVNGQTGKVVGSLPNSSGTNWGYFMKRVGAVALAGMVFAAVKYLLGR